MQRQIIYHHNLVRITEKRKNVPTGREDEWTIREGDNITEPHH